MNRRRFLRKGAAGVALLGAAGGVGFNRRHRARETITSGMLDDALPPLTANSSKEMNTLPARGREEIKRYFHGKCLNVEGFVSLVCSDEFAERVGSCETEDQRANCFLHAFCSR